MLKLIKDRIAVIVALVAGTGSGFTMTSFVTAPELKDRLIPIAMAVSLLLSFIISFSIGKQRVTIKFKEKMVRRLVWVFAGFLIFIAVFFFMYDRLTVSIPVLGGDGKTISVDNQVVVKGYSYTPEAVTYRDAIFKKNHLYPEEPAMLADFGYKIPTIYTETSRSLAGISLLFLYAAMIAFFTGGVTLVTELIRLSLGKSAYTD